MICFSKQTGWLVVFLCCALFVAIVGQSGITQSTATLSEARWKLAATSSGDLVFFGGGNKTTGPSAQVDICNVTSGSWTTATLSVPRFLLAATSADKLVFFGGGEDTQTNYAQVDIYNTSDGSWSTATLSQNRSDLAGTSVANIVLFGGGQNSTGPSSTVDIYNVTSNTWTTATLSQARDHPAATSVANRYALFAGGSNWPNLVDIFDSFSETWNTATLSLGREYIAATSLNNLALFGGGDTWGGTPSNVVDIFNATTHTWSSATLSQARYGFAAASVGDIVAFGGGNNGSKLSVVVDMYNVTSNVWFTATLSQARYYLAAASSINGIFFGGGYGSTYSQTVDIFTVNLSNSPSPSYSSGSPNLSPTTLSPSSTPLTANTPVFVLSPMSPPLSLLSTNSPFSNVSSTDHTPSPSHNFETLILVIVLLCAVVLIAIGVAVVIILWRKRKKQHSKRPSESSQEIETAQRVKSTASQSVGYAALEEPLQEIPGLTIQPQIPFEELSLEKEIGRGHYGKVCLGKWKSQSVALKFCKEKGTLEEFLREANVMIGLPPHQNLVQFFGVSIDGPQPIIVLEYCAEGSLDVLLFDRGIKLSTDEKLKLVEGIAKGLCHLHKHNIVHRDLAARNILLTQQHQPKISDFGMSRFLAEDVEGQTFGNVGPIRWMAPEALQNRKYSKKTDVWSFGIVVYEITAQREPHVQIPPKEVVRLIRDEALTPEIPAECPPALEELMRMCWRRDPKERPTLESICKYLKINPQ